MHHTNDKYCKCPLFKYLTLWWTLFISLICTSFDWCSNYFLQEAVAISSNSQKNSLSREEFLSFYKELTTRPEVYFLMARFVVQPIITLFLNLTPKSFVNLKHKLLPIRINLELFNFE